MTASQLTAVVDLIVEEMLVSAQTECSEDEDSQPGSVSSGRLTLLLHCICEDVERVVAVVDHLQGVYTNVSG